MRRVIAFALGGILLYGPGLAAPAETVLVVWDSTQAQGAAAYKELLILLQKERAMGHFVGLPIASSFHIYDFALPAHARSIKMLGLGRPQGPQVCLTQVNGEGIPSKLTWHHPVTSAQEAMKALDQHLGIVPAEPPSIVTPSPSATPSASPQPPPPVAALSVGDTFTTGLTQGMYVESENRRFRFAFQTDGNGVVYEGRQPRWQTGTCGCNTHLSLERNGQLRVIHEERSLWKSQYEGLIGQYRCRMQDDGNLVVEQLLAGQWNLCWSSMRGVEGSYRLPPGVRLDRRRGR